MVNRLVSVGDDFTLPAAVKAADANLPARLQDTALNATIATEVGKGVNAAVNPSQTVAGFGDSMFGDQGGIGTTTLSVLAQALGVDVYRGGVPGQTSTEAALRQGGLDVRVTVAGNTIPAGTTPVTVTIPVPTGTWKTGSAWSYTGILAGVPGTLAKSATEVWTFTRAAAGTAVTVEPEAKWISTPGVDNAGRVQLFRVGRNNPTDAALVLRDYIAMSRGMSAAKPRFLALPVYNASSEPSGSSGYNVIAAVNAKLAEAFGPNYYDLRGWLIRNGLTAAGITPTTEDTTAMAEDRIPPSLMMDTVHLNLAGRIVEGNRLAAILVERGWFPSYTPVPVPQPVVATVTNLATNPTVGTNTTSWGVAAGTGGTATGERITTGGPVADAPTLYRATWTVSPTGQAQVNNNGSTVNLVSPSKEMRFTAYAKPSWAGAKLQALIGWYNGATYLGTSGATVVNGTSSSWSLLEALGTSPATATRAQLSVLILPTGTLPPVGATIDVSAMMLHERISGSTFAIPYRDGDSEGWAWSGTAHASSSSGPVTIG